MGPGRLPLTFGRPRRGRGNPSRAAFQEACVHARRSRSHITGVVFRSHQERATRWGARSRHRAGVDEDGDPRGGATRRVVREQVQEGQRAEGATSPSRTRARDGVPWRDLWSTDAGQPSALRLGRALGKSLRAGARSTSACRSLTRCSARLRRDLTGSSAGRAPADRVALLQLACDGRGARSGLTGGRGRKRSSTAWPDADLERGSLKTVAGPGLPRRPRLLLQHWPITRRIPQRDRHHADAASAARRPTRHQHRILLRTGQSR